MYMHETETDYGRKIIGIRRKGEERWDESFYPKKQMKKAPHDSDSPGPWDPDPRDSEEDEYDSNTCTSDRSYNGCHVVNRRVINLETVCHQKRRIQPSPRGGQMEILTKESEKVARKNEKLSEHESNSTWSLQICLGFLVIIILIAGIHFVFSKGDSGYKMQIPHSNDLEPSYELILANLKTKIKEMKNVFTQQDNDMWGNILSGIMQTFEEPERPSIFLLFANDKQPMECLAQTIADMSRHALGTKDILILQPGNLGTDYGLAIDKLRPRVEISKTVVVIELLNIHADALMAFHNLCDRIEPLVKKAVFVITITTDGYRESDDSTTAYVEKLMRNKLTGKIDEDMIPPLVTRITDGPIFFVKPENIPTCPINTDSFTSL